MVLSSKKKYSVGNGSGGRRVVAGGDVSNTTIAI